MHGLTLSFAFSGLIAEAFYKKETVENTSFVPFCDNLAGQVADDFRTAIQEQDGIPWFGVPNATDIWQPVDGGYAATLKTFVKHAFFNWLDDDDNVEKWYGIDSKFTASQKRILVTHWCGAAYRKLTDPRFDDFRHCLFEKTGCLIAADGTNDDLINPEGLPDYAVPPPMPLDPAVDPPQILPPPEVTANAQDRNAFNVFDDFEDPQEMDGIEVVEEGELVEDGWVFNIFEGLDD